MDPQLLCLDQVSVDLRHAHQGIGRGLLVEVADAGREFGYTAITGTTLRDLIFNGLFTKGLAASRTRTRTQSCSKAVGSSALGLGKLGARAVIGLSL